MRTMMNRTVALFALILIAGCGQNTSGDYDSDSGDLPADGMVTADSMEAVDADVVIGASDGEVGEVHDGGDTIDSDAGDPECYSDDDCPEGQICMDGQCVCDGDDDDGEDESCASGKTLLCHYPPGNPANLHNICVGTPAVPAHLAHGDTLGVCP